MTIKNKHGVFTKPYSYNQCPTVGCSYELPKDLPIAEWPNTVAEHTNNEHDGSSIWTKLIPFVAK